MKINKVTAADIEKVFRDGPEWVKAPAPVVPRIPTRPGRVGAISIMAPIMTPIISPIMQEDEKMIIGAPGGVKISVKMSDIKKELNKRLGLDIFTNNMMKGGRS